MNAPLPRPSPGPAARLGLPPAPVLRAYLLAWIPLAIVYMVATETDGDFSNGIDIASALRGGARGIGPAMLLLPFVWGYTGMMARRGFGLWRVLANHIGMAGVFAVVWHVCIYLWLWLANGRAVADAAQHNWFIWQAMWGMMLYWAVAGGFTAYRAIEQARHDAAAAAQAQALLARTELAALRNKLNPHFLFNTLHSIIALTRRPGAQAEQALQMFSDMLRYVLDTERQGRDHVPLQQELDFTRDYLALEALRLGARLQVDWQVDPLALGCEVPALTVQPLVENSIRHAFNPRSAPGRLQIGVALADGGRTLVVTVSDDGPGCAPEAVDAGSGLGLRTVARRLAVEHGPQASLRITTQPAAGFSARLQLPVAA